MKYYDSNPKNGGKEIDFWTMFKQSGMIDSLLENHGIQLIPTHDYRLLKEHRLAMFEKTKKDFINERQLKKLEISDSIIRQLYDGWLNHEIDEIQKWLSNKPSHSDQVEILKYKDHVLSGLGNDKVKKGGRQKAERKPFEKLISTTYCEIYRAKKKGFIESHKHLKGKELAILLRAMEQLGMIEAKHFSNATALFESTMKEFGNDIETGFKGFADYVKIVSTNFPKEVQNKRIELYSFFEVGQKIAR